MLTESGNHINHTGGPVVLTKLRSLAPGSERGLLCALLVATSSVHQVVGPGFSVRLTRAGLALDPKNGSAPTPLVDTQQICTVVHNGGPMCPAVHGVPVPKGGPGPAPGLTAPFRTRVPLALGVSGSGASGVRARVAHVTWDLKILRPHF